MLRLRSQAVRRLGTPSFRPACPTTASRTPRACGLQSSIAARRHTLNEGTRTFTSSASWAAKNSKDNKKVAASASSEAATSATSTPKEPLPQDTAEPSADNAASKGPSTKRSKPKQGKPWKGPPPEPKSVDTVSHETQQQLRILQGALAALKKVFEQQNIKVDDIKKPKRRRRRADTTEAPEEETTESPTPQASEITKPEDQADAATPRRARPRPKKFNGERKLAYKPVNAETMIGDRQELDKLKAELKAHARTSSKSSRSAAPKLEQLSEKTTGPESEQLSEKTTDPESEQLSEKTTDPESEQLSEKMTTPESAGLAFSKHKRRPRRPKKIDAGSELPSDPMGNSDEPVADIADQSPVQISRLDPEGFELVPIERAQPPVATLAHGLERVLFNQGVYDLQDPRSKVYNFDPYLANIMPIKEFDFNALQQYITSSKDTSLISVARENGKKYTGSTSSMTSMLTHFHYLLSGWRKINSEMVSKNFDIPSDQFTALLRSPAATFLHYKDGVYAIDADKQFDQSSILSMLGKSMEKLLTLPVEGYERYRRINSHEITEEERNAPEAYHYTGLGDFMMRSQLDAYDPRVPGTGMFDIKTRSVVSIRMDAKGFEKGLGYEIRNRRGNWESYEREYHDMIRSAFLKYSLQVRMGRMDGIFVAFHNTQRIFGFQYIPLDEMDVSLHGQSDRTLGDKEFKLSLALLNELLNRATERFPEKSLRLFVETRTSANTPFMYAFVKPVETGEIDAIQSSGKASADEIERRLLGLQDEIESGSVAENEAESESATIDEEKACDVLEEQETAEVEELEETTASWDEIQMIVEDAMEDEELGVGAVRQAIEDALEESGLLEEQSPEETRDYVDALLSTVVGGSTQSPAAAVDPSSSLEANQEPADDTTSVAETGSLEMEGVVQDEGSVSSGEVDRTTDPNSTTDSTQRTENTPIPSSPTATSDADTAQEVTSAEESSEGEAEPEEYGSQDDATSIPNMSTLRNAILRMTRKIDEDGLADEQQDDAVSSKLQDFERILSKIISESRDDVEETGDAATRADISEATESTRPTDEAAEELASPTTATDSPPSVPTSSPEADAGVEPKQEELGPILGMVLTIRNKVNDKFIERPENLTKDDTWEVEYKIEELEVERAHRLYKMCGKRRTMAYGKGKARTNSWNKMFGGSLSQYVEEGRRFREEENKRATEQPVVIFGQATKSFNEVFGKK